MKKRFSTFLAVLLCTATAIFADGPFRNHRYDSFKVLEPAEGSILFIGNSITDMHCWPEVFKTSDDKYLPIVNRGNSGTYSTEQSDNLESYLVNKPKKVFMMIGTNDIATSGGLNFSPEQVLAYVKSIVARIHARSPQTKVYLYSILNNKTGNRVEATWLKANELTKAYADTTDKVTYIDLYDKLANVASGGAWSYDNLHLTAGAYQVWAKEICQYLQEGEDYTVSCVYPENTLDVQNNGGLDGANGMRATYFSALPISKNDVLIFGDSFIKNGEWQELLGNPNVKNRGTGWGNSGDIATTSKIVDATFAEVEGVTKESPKAILLYTGTGDCTGSTDMETVQANYKALVDKILQKSPNSIVYLLTLCFRNNESHNKRIQELNGYMAGFPMKYANLRFVETGKQLLNNGEMDSKYIFSNDYIGGLAYVKIANLLKDAIDDDFPDDVYTVINDATAETRYAQAGLRNQLTQAIARGLVATRGNAAGQYDVEKMKAFDTKVSTANTLLEKTNITQEEVTTFTDELNTILNGALSMPTNSTEGKEVWYQLYTPGRGNKYLTSTGAGAGVNGTAANNYATSMWKFVARNNGGIDIINRHDGSYLAPTAAGSSQLTTSATQPTNAWSLSYSDAPGLFVINSGTVQLHQTNDAAVWNWGGGTNRSDTGCQYQIEAVEGEPDVEPIVPTDANFSNVVKNINDLTDGWYKMRVVTGSDDTMNGYITNGNNHVLNANVPYRQSATNFYPLKIGAYDINKPATGWVKVKKVGNKYQIQGIGGHTINENCTANRDITQANTTLSMSYGGFTTVDKWHYYNPGANTEQPYIGKSSSSDNKFAFAPVTETELAAYDIYTVTIDAENATEIGSDPSITYTGTAAIGGIAKVFNNGYMFFPKGSVPAAEDFTVPNGLYLKVSASAKTLTVNNSPEAIETLTLTSTQFANGTSTYTKHTASDDGWYGKLVTGTTPALTIESTDNTANNIGWASNQPWLQEGYTYNLSLPEGFKIVEYELTTKQGLAFTGTFTYTTAEGTATSAAQSSSEQTVSADGLSTSSITLNVGEGENGTGILITKLIIKYKEADGEEAELAAAKNTAKASVTANAANLKEALGYYSYTVGGTKVYSVSAVTAAIDEAATVEAVDAIVATYSLNVPEVGKYYRIKSKSSGKYVDAAGLNNTTMNMKTEAERDFFGSIFLLDEGSKWLNMATNTYIKDTHTIGADKAGANTWTFEASPRTLGCLLVKSNGGSPYLHDSDPKTNRCSGDGGHAAHDFIIEEVKAYSLTVDAPVIVGATATWNGETKKLPAVWALFEGMTITNGTLTINGNANYRFTSMSENGTAIEGNTIEIGALTANRTITASFTPSFFSVNTNKENLVPVHIYNTRNTNYTICLNEANGYADHAVNSGTTDYTLDEVWYLVGTAESFKMYSYTAGMDLALTLAGTGRGSAATMTATGTELCLVMTENGYAICPKGATGQSFNMHGGAGADIKLYDTTDGGSIWGINVIGIANPLTLNVEVSGKQPYEVNYRVANLSTTIAGQKTTSIITGDVEARKYYLPADATISLNNAYVYRGYKFDGFKDAQGNAAEYNETAIPAGGLELTVSYSVDEANKYQYLFYSNDPVMNKPYRIPAIAVTRKGTILAVTDHRPGGSDVGFAPVDIKLRRSNDNGQTWSDEEFIADGTGQHVTIDDVTHTNVFDYAFGDAAIVADRESDEVLIMCVGGKQNFPGGDATHHNYTARLRSHDGGVTWDEPENVTANFMDVTPLYNNENPNGYQPILPEAYTLFYGSGRILQSRVFKAEGSRYYRIYAALLVREVVPGATGASHNNYVVYSDNFGETWNLLGSRCVLGGDEAKVEELPDGTIIISSRKGNGRYFNIFSFTDIAKAEGSWSSQVASENIAGGIKYGNNACNGEFYKVKAIHNETGRICDLMMQSVPTGQRGDYTADGRNDVTIFFKEMNYGATYTPTTFAENWTKGMVVSRVRSAYSTMDLQADGKFAFFYEEDPESYCMVYVPLSLEEITDGAYSLYTVNSTISEHGIATFYATSAMQIPEGVKVYVATETPVMNGETGNITMTELEDVIPANTGAVLRGDADTYQFLPSISYGTPTEGNMLVGFEAANNKGESTATVTVPTDGSTNYVLAVENEKAGFYKKNADFAVYNNKAYLNLPASVAGARALYFSFGDGATGIFETESGEQKTENCYDLSGRRVEKAQKGIYIVNGKKVVR